MELDIKIQHENHNLIIEERKITRIYEFFPFFFSAISSNLSEKDGRLMLHTYDQIASSRVGSRKYIGKFYTMNPFTKTIKMIVPKNSLRSLDVHLENGNIFLKNVKLQHANIVCLRGNIKINNSNIDTISINGYTSNISLKNVTGNNCSATTRTGDLNLEGNSPTQTTLTTTLGNIRVISDDYGLKYTLVDILSKELKIPHFLPSKETQKILRCRAPHGTVSSNVF